MGMLGKPEKQTRESSSTVSATFRWQSQGPKKGFQKLGLSKGECQMGCDAPTISTHGEGYTSHEGRTWNMDTRKRHGGTCNVSHCPHTLPLPDIGGTDGRDLEARNMDPAKDRGDIRQLS